MLVHGDDVVIEVTIDFDDEVQLLWGDPLHLTIGGAVVRCTGPGWVHHFRIWFDPADDSLLRWSMSPSAYEAITETLPPHLIGQFRDDLYVWARSALDNWRSSRARSTAGIVQ